MSTNEDPYIAKLRELKPKFKEMNIKRLRVFGSRARGDARPDSDLDLIVDFEKPVSMIDLSECKIQLEKKLNGSIDLILEEYIIPEFRENILQEATDV